VDAVLTASRVLVSIAARSLAGLDEEVTIPQFRSLVVIASRGPQGMGELAAALAVTSSTASRVCDRLEQKGLVRRRRDTSDRRYVLVALTAPGREMVDAVTQRRRVDIAKLVESVPTDARQSVVDGLRQLAEAAGEVPEESWITAPQDSPPAAPRA